MFDLAFIRDESQQQEEGWYALEGEILLGGYRERFLAALGPWDRRAYERHWIAAATHLLEGADRTAFITSAFQFWWPMWRVGDDVFVQEQLLLAEPAARRFDPAEPFAAIADREVVSEDGRLISEWQIGLPDVAAFVTRRASRYVPA